MVECVEIFRGAYTCWSGIA